MAVDTLAYAKHLEQAGVERRQAEAHAEAARLYSTPDVTKADLQDLVTKADLKAALSPLATKAELQHLATKTDLYEVQHTLLRWVVGLFMVQIFAIIGLTITLFSRLPSLPPGITK